MIKYGLIGAGMMGQEHLANLNLIDGAEIAAIADPDQGSLNGARAMMQNHAHHPVTYYDQYQEMVARENCDAIILATPNHTHFQIVRDLAHLETAILIEKPVCTTMADAQALVMLEETASCRLAVGLEYRYMPPLTQFINRAHAGEAGPVRMLSIREHRFPFLPKVDNWNRFNENTGGTLVEKCCHFFDLMRHILRDEPVRVYASGAQDVNHLDETYDGRTPDIIDNAFVVVDFRGGARAILDLCMYAEGSEQQEVIHVVGAQGKLEVSIPGADVTWSPRDKSGPFVEHVDTPEKAMLAGQHHGATYFQLQAFHQAVTAGEPFPITVEDGIRSLEMGIAAHRSLATGQAVSLPLEDTPYRT
ncbi:Gfo/Idh/MocA family protein [Parvularcula sp. IMCC14364]|uniref:Gfo/Idh/MocA family protein n=1 Tax=Parvularcula sp. IMCC14364 TaxID=3067902 RepID=UPI00274199D1|nr:Gfo/Idh/MocA family oxidoreductase [Parvularcula sp. IMCC14364]